MLENILLVIAGLVLLIWGADRFVHGAAAAARNLGVAPLLIGLTVVAFATSAPEILVSVVAALQGKPGLAFGNAIGSNIFNIGLVLGLTAMIRPILLESATLRREMPALLAVSLLTVSLFLDSFLSRIDGIVLLTGLVIVMVWLARLGLRSATNDPIARDYDAEIPVDVTMMMAVVWLIVGLGTLLIGAELLVDGAIGIARMLQISRCRYRHYHRRIWYQPARTGCIAGQRTERRIRPGDRQYCRLQYIQPAGGYRRRRSDRACLIAAICLVIAYICHGGIHARVVCHDLRLRRQGPAEPPRRPGPVPRISRLRWLRDCPKHVAKRLDYGDSKSTEDSSCLTR